MKKIFRLFACSAAVLVAAALAAIIGAARAERLRSSETVSELSLTGFCERHFGRLSDDSRHCRFEQIFQLGRTGSLKSSTLPNDLQLQPGDTVSLSGAQGVIPSVGGESYGDGALEFVCATPGKLSLTAANGASAFFVAEIKVSRCIGEVGGKLALRPCPN